MDGLRLLGSGDCTLDGNGVHISGIVLSMANLMPIYALNMLALPGLEIISLCNISWKN